MRILNYLLFQPLELTLLILLITFTILCLLLIIFITYSKKKNLKNNAQTVNDLVETRQLIQRISYEINTALNGIIGITKLAKNNDNIEKVQKYLDDINYTSIHLTQILSDVTQTTNNTDLNSNNNQTINPHAQLSYLKTVYDLTAKNKNISINYIDDINIPENIILNHKATTDILTDIVNFAISFSDENGQLTVSCTKVETQADTRLMFFVETNIQIPTNLLILIFSSDYNSDKYKSLYNSFELAKNIGSELLFDNSIDTKTKLYFSVPFKEKVVDNTTENFNMKGKFLLIVEDSKINQMIVGSIFDELEANYEIAENGLEAFNKFSYEPEKYDLILMDIQMPILDGLEATKKIRNSNLPNALTVPIIAMTANVFQEDIEKSKNAGMNAHLCKPLELNEIKSVLSNVLTK